MVSRSKKTTNKDPEFVPQWKYKRDKKSTSMWIEQLLLKVDDINKRLDGFEERVSKLEKTKSV